MSRRSPLEYYMDVLHALRSKGPKTKSSLIQIANLQNDASREVFSHLEKQGLIILSSRWGGKVILTLKGSTLLKEFEAIKQTLNL